MLLCFTITLSAQTYELYRCETTSKRSIANNGTASEWSEPADGNFIIRFDLQNNKLEFENQLETIIYITKRINKYDQIDDDGDSYLFVRYAAYDKNGLRLNFVSMDYYGLPNRIFIIEYADSEFAFFCKYLDPGTNIKI